MPYFRRLIANGATELPITDIRMTRFVITLDQAVDFVINSFASMEGGEIFVPKIPSVRIVDLARAMAPKAGHKIVGIRPGEKLHEVMVTEDDARQTIDIDSAYVVVPRNPIWTDAYKAPEGSAVPEDFVYSSDRNTEWVSGDGLTRLIGADGGEG